MVSTRNKHIPAVYADNAETVIPDEPVQGVAYRNVDLADEVTQLGLLYAKIVDSGDFNQFLYNMSSVVQLVDQQGILGWSDKVTYGLSSIVRGSDGVFYVSQSVNGPGQIAGVRDPSTSAHVPDYWVTLAQDLGVGTGTIDLSANKTANAVTIVNSSGANAQITSATSEFAGVMGTDDKVKLDGIEPNAQKNVTPTVGIIHRSSDVQISLNNAQEIGTIGLVAANRAGLMAKDDKVKLDNIPAGGGDSPPTNLSVSRTATNVAIESSTGANATLSGATSSLAGVMSRDDKVKLDGIPTGGGGGANLGTTQTASAVTVTSDSGSDATIQAASASRAGVMTVEDKTKLDGVAGNAEPNVPTNLTAARNATSVVVQSSTGTNATIAVANESLAGVMAAADKAKLDGIPEGGGPGNPANIIVSRGTNYVTVDSSTGSSDTIHAASSSLAGVMTVSDKIKLDNIQASADVNRPIASKAEAEAGTNNSKDMTPLRVKESVLAHAPTPPPTNLSITRAGTSVTLKSSTGTDATISQASTSLAGMMGAADKAKLNGIEAGADVNDPTNITIGRGSSSVVVQSSTGSNGTISAASSSSAGVMTAAQKSKLDGIQAGADANVSTNLSVSTTSTTATVNSSTGDNGTIPAATSTKAGVMTASQHNKLSGIASGADVNVPTNLSTSRSSTSVSVNSSTGSNITLSRASTSLAGVMSAADKSKLDGIQASADVNRSIASKVTAQLGVSNSQAMTPLRVKEAINVVKDRFHVFFSSDSSWSPPHNGRARIFVIGGGGAGGMTSGSTALDGGGGGGAGGNAIKTTELLTSNNYSITVGAGGSGVNIAGDGINGGQSKFSGGGLSITGNGGGGGNAQIGSSGGYGGSASGGDLNLTGGSGGRGSLINADEGGGGGSIGGFRNGVIANNNNGYDGGDGEGSGGGGAGVGGNGADHVGDNSGGAGGGVFGPASGTTPGLGPDDKYLEVPNKHIFDFLGGSGAYVDSILGYFYYGLHKGMGGRGGDSSSSSSGGFGAGGGGTGNNTAGGHGGLGGGGGGGGQDSKGGDGIVVVEYL